MKTLYRKPITKGYYIIKTIEDKWGIAYWDNIKWWDDPNQDGKLRFGIKDSWIKEWHNLPKEQGKEEETNHFEIDFDGNCKSNISIVNNKLVVNYAMSGWGEPIDIKNIRVTQIKVK